MARLLYGNTPADFTLSPAGKILPNVPLTVWTDREGGTQVTDLLTGTGQPTGILTSDSTGLVRFYGPDGYTSTLWIASGVGSRLAVRPVNLPTAGLSIGTVGTGSAGATIVPDGLDAWTLNLTLPSAGTNGVNTAAIQNDAVTAAKIADNAVGASELADNAVDTAAIQDNAVTAAKIAAGAVGSLLLEQARSLSTFDGGTPFQGMDPLWPTLWGEPFADCGTPSAGSPTHTFDGGTL